METKIEKIIQKYDCNKAYLVPILQDVQREFNYLPKEQLQELCAVLNVPISQIYEVSTFYRAFSLTPRGKHQLSLCLGTACHVRGAPLLGDTIERTLSLKAGETSSDLEFTYETVNCLGACASGPILVADGEYQGHMTISKTNKLLKQLGKKVQTDDE